jgi:endonuclease G
MKKLVLSFLLLFTSFACLAECEDLAFNRQLPKTSQSLMVLCKQTFVIGYSTASKIAIWTAHTIESRTLLMPDTERKNVFKPDPNIPRESQSSSSAYAGSGYDRGHLVPFDDLAYSAEEAAKSFMMTNIIPQIPQNNRQLWKSVETFTRKIASKNKKIFVITGTVHDEHAIRLVDGTPVPSHIWRIIIIPDKKVTYTFIVPNKLLPNNKFSEFISTVKKLKQLIPGVDPIPADSTLTDIVTVK